MTTASRSLATALWRARFASGLLRPSYTTTRDTTFPASFGHWGGRFSLIVPCANGAIDPIIFLSSQFTTPTLFIRMWISTKPLWDNCITTLVLHS